MRGAFFSPGLRGRKDLEGQKREENVKNFPKTAFLTSLDSPDGMFWETNNSIGLG
jgi:pyruvate dehydrogenase complex dehydrogenase (E1) component